MLPAFTYFWWIFNLNAMTRSIRVKLLLACCLAAISVLSYAQERRLELPFVKPSEKVIAHYAYQLLYNEAAEQASWVAYTLCSENLSGKSERTNRFMEDPMVITGSATSADYEASGFDRGHLCPAADMAWNEVAMRESFYYSNMSPQLPSFNRGVWKRLEEQVRTWGRQYGKIYVVVGPVLEKGLPTIGANKVAIPRYYYKVILRYGDTDAQAIGFIMPNEKSQQPLNTFAVAVDSVEKVTGIDFFCALPDSVEKRVEATLDHESWSWESVAAKPQKAVELQGKQCKAITGKGTRCSRKSNDGTGYCYQHGSQK